jgi:hypothetical protein
LRIATRPRATLPVDSLCSAVSSIYSTRAAIFSVALRAKGAPSRQREEGRRGGVIRRRGERRRNTQGRRKPQAASSCIAIPIPVLARRCTFDRLLSKCTSHRCRCKGTYSPGMYIQRLLSLPLQRGVPQPRASRPRQEVRRSSELLVESFRSSMFETTCLHYLAVLVNYCSLPQAGTSPSGRSPPTNRRANPSGERGASSLW